MIATIHLNSKKHLIDLSKPIDISIAINQNNKNITAWGIKKPRIFAEESNGKKISVADGAPVNFNSIHFNPHSHITHTECLGHITEEFHSINQNLNNYFFLAELITVAPEKLNDDLVISKKQIQKMLGNKKREAIIIRTLPNLSDKKLQQYSNTNPPYLLEDAAIYLKEKNIQHLLIDLPSIDKEQDEGKLLAHNAFWDIANKKRYNATITELIFVPNRVNDGCYMLNLMIAPFDNDATPSKPILYKIE